MVVGMYCSDESQDWLRMVAEERKTSIKDTKMDAGI